MTTGNHPAGEPPAYFHPIPERPAARSGGSALRTLFRLARCLLAWPAVFASVVVATFVGVAVYFDDPGGPLFWPFAWVGSAIAYALLVGVPMSLCGHRRRWYLRLIPTAIVAVPVVWLLILAGVWAIPGAATIAVSIMVETIDWRHKSPAWTRNR